MRFDVKQWRMRQKRQPVPQDQGKKAAQGETPAATKNGANKGTVKGTGKKAPRRRRTSRETRNEYVLRGPRLAVGLNKLWKRVVPSETEFAWLPPDIAWAFCSVPSAGEETANVWPSMKRTWGCRDVLSRRAFLLWIWCSLVTQEVLKSLRFSRTWPQKGCV